jgi:hypothetical protein
MVPISLVPAVAVLCFYVSTFRSMCSVPNMAVFCSALTSWFPGMLLAYFLNNFEIVPVRSNYYYYCSISCHPVAVVLTLVQTKQIRLNIYKRNNTKNTIQTTQNTVNTSTHITKTPKRYKTSSYTHPHITKQVKTTTVQDTHQMK